MNCKIEDDFLITTHENLLLQDVNIKFIQRHLGAAKGGFRIEAAEC